jgi:hypothetical protein
MGLRLLVNRVEVPQLGFSAMLWTEDEDARLVEWKEFSGTVTLGVWLAGVAGKYGRGNIKIDWTPQLMADARLRELITSILAPVVSPDAVN